MTPWEQLYAAFGLLHSTVNEHPDVMEDMTFMALRRACYELRDPKAGEVLRDAAWLVSRVTFALGPPGGSPDLELARERLRVLRDFLLVSQTDYGCIGEPYPPKPYAVFMLVPGELDRVVLLPKLEHGKYERVADGVEVYAALHGRRVPWPPFEPPAVSALAAEDWQTTGFYPAAKLVKGDAKLPADVAAKVGG